MSKATSIEFFKKQELIDLHNLMSTPSGEERLAVCSEAVYKFFGKLANDINLDIKAVIAGWRRGYSAETVADYLFDRRFSSLIDVDYKVPNTMDLFRSMFELMGYPEDYTWGNQYGYYPSLGEGVSDPLEVQEAINARATKIANDAGFETILFGQYQNGTGALRNDKERPLVDAFRKDVADAFIIRRDSFFIVTEFDDGETE